MCACVCVHVYVACVCVYVCMCMVSRITVHVCVHMRMYICVGLVPRPYFYIKLEGSKIGPDVHWQGPIVRMC